MSEGYSQFKEKGEKLKQEVAGQEELKEVAKKEAESALDVLRNNSNLTKMYQDNAQLGAENLQGELPLLKIQSTGRSQKNKLADGNDPTDGYFFYKPTGEQFKEVNCHILTISKGFRAKGMEDGGESKFNQIMAGIIVNDGQMRPFVMYMTGLKLSRMWEFTKTLSRYTHLKPVSIPMFALTVKMITSKQKNSYGESWVIDFDLVKTKDGQPELVLDEGEMKYLTDSVSLMQETIKNVINTQTNSTAQAATLTPDGEEGLKAAAFEAAADIPFD